MRLRNKKAPKESKDGADKKDVEPPTDPSASEKMDVDLVTAPSTSEQPPFLPATLEQPPQPQQQHQQPHDSGMDQLRMQVQQLQLQVQQQSEQARQYQRDVQQQQELQGLHQFNRQRAAAIRMVRERFATERESAEAVMRGVRSRHDGWLRRQDEPTGEAELAFLDARVAAGDQMIASLFEAEGEILSVLLDTVVQTDIDSASDSVSSRAAEIQQQSQEQQNGVSPSAEIADATVGVMPSSQVAEMVQRMPDEHQQRTQQIRFSSARSAAEASARATYSRARSDAENELCRVRRERDAILSRPRHDSVYHEDLRLADVSIAAYETLRHTLSRDEGAALTAIQQSVESDTLDLIARQIDEHIEQAKAVCAAAIEESVTL